MLRAFGILPTVLSPMSGIEETLNAYIISRKPPTLVVPGSTVTTLQASTIKCKCHQGIPDPSMVPPGKDSISLTGNVKSKLGMAHVSPEVSNTMAVDLTIEMSLCLRGVAGTTPQRNGEGGTQQALPMV